MKIFKTITLGMMFLFGLTVMADEPNEAIESKSAEATAVQECYLTYSACEDQYPRSGGYDDFDRCMQRGGC